MGSPCWGMPQQGPIAPTQREFPDVSVQYQLADEGPEGPHPQEALLQRPGEPLGTIVALGSADESGRRCGAEPGDRAPEVAEHGLAAVVVPDDALATLRQARFLMWRNVARDDPQSYY